jgi:PhzF family phenazine biosynthesis protein
MDVFTAKLYRGNPAAVVFDASDLTAKTMQAIAREINLSDTAFVLPPTDPVAHYRMRFFTSRSELPFAGHPTIAMTAAVTAHDERLANWVPGVLRQECGLGLIPVEAFQTEGRGNEFTMTQAAPSYRDVPLARETAAEMLLCVPANLSELPMRVVSTGVP